MVFTISKKMILAFLGLTLVVLMSTLGLARWSFEQGFLDYVNALEEARLKQLAESLSGDYLAAGNSWSTLTEQRFELLLQEHASAHQNEKDGARRPPPPGYIEPPPDSPLSTPSGSKPLEDRPRIFGPPTALYNSHGELIVGRQSLLEEIKPIRVPVLVDGQLVGELRTAPRRYFSSPQETAFSRQQWITSGLIGFVALVLAVMVSLWLTRVLLAPIRRTIVGISRLSSGDYATRLNEHRTDELGQLMGDLDRLAHKLEENRSSRQRWLADISHELRTPMTVLTGEIESLKDGIRPLDMNQVHSLDQEVTRLRRLIDDLYELSVSDIGGLRYNFVPVDIWRSVNTAVDAIRVRTEEKGIALEVVGATDSWVSADSQRLDQLFTNLLENALAYTDSPGRIKVTLSREGEKVVIKIQDTPPGMDEGDGEKLFEPLYRHEISRSRRTAGAGLGLAICRNIVDAHQGTITASPSELGGLCIEIIFPLMTDK